VAIERNESAKPDQRFGASVLLTNLQLAHVGDYTVIVTNVVGAVTSQVARLRVDPTFPKITAGNIVTDLNDYWSGSWADYDNDGYLDLFVGTWWNSQTNYLYHNNGDGTFARVPAASIPKIPSNQHGSTWGDYDNDGYLDLMVTSGNPEVAHNVIYRNNGNGTFTAVTNGPIYDETTLGLCSRRTSALLEASSQTWRASPQAAGSMIHFAEPGMLRDQTTAFSRRKARSRVPGWRSPALAKR